MANLSLPARLGYAILAFPVVGTVAFYVSTWIWPRFSGVDIEAHGYGIFAGCIGIGAVVGFTAFLFALTLPWKRRRRRTGRGRRTVIACVVVVFVSLVMADVDHSVIYDLLLAAWLAYSLAFTYVRYGVRDPERSHHSRSSASAESYEG
jgi:hypothetical protein